MIRKRKENIKLLGALCEERLPGTKYDRFFSEEFCKKLKTGEEVENFINSLKDINDSDKFKTALEQ